MAWHSGILERLNAGDTVKLRPHGNSMVPIIKSGQLVTLAPLTLKDGVPQYEGREVTIDDAVFCKVHGRLMIHKVTAIRGGQYQISNNHGHVNGWTMAKNLHGLVVAVEP